MEPVPLQHGMAEVDLARDALAQERKAHEATKTQAADREKELANRLAALERQGRGRLLSTPKVTTQNNMSAEIKQGLQIPIQTVANNTVTVQFKDAVLTLKVTPQITDSGTVILNLEVENNSADFANLLARNDYLGAGLYFTASVFISVAALFAGLALVRAL